MTQRSIDEVDSIKAAIENVLNAERDGLRELKRRQDDAQNLLTRARAKAATIRQHTGARISRLHTVVLANLQPDIQKSHVASVTGDVGNRSYDKISLADAADRVALRLIGE